MKHFLSVISGSSFFALWTAMINLLNDLSQENKAIRFSILAQRNVQ